MFENVYTRTSGSGLYVQVRITLDALGLPSVVVSPDAFSRFGDSGGPDDAYVVAVAAGATDALQEAGTGGSVTILDVDFAPAQTSPDDVRLASSIAVRNALRKASGS